MYFSRRNSRNTNKYHIKPITAEIRKIFISEATKLSIGEGNEIK